MNFNESQKMAIETIYGPVIIIACPGSGKTSSLVNRTKHMIEAGIDPSQIVVMTFTKKAALEMTQRFKRLVPNSPARFGTIHSVALEIYNAERGRSVEVLPESETWTIMRNIVKDVLKKRMKKERMENMENKGVQKEWDEDDINDMIKAMITEISTFRNSGMNIQKIPETWTPSSCSSVEEFIHVFLSYRDIKKQKGKMDFDDILVNVDQMFRRNPGILNRWQDRYRFIMVDEFQDVNDLQADIIYMLAGKYRNLCVVGDDDQSIYKFRGARPGIMLEFPKYFPEAKVIKLSVNYRSGRKIIEAANHLICHNDENSRFEKDFQIGREDEGEITISDHEMEELEYRDLCNSIQKSHENGMAYKDMAVLYRSVYQGIGLSFRLLAQGIPFVCRDDIRKLSTYFIFKDIEAFYRLATGTGSRSDFVRIMNKPNRYLKKSAISQDANTLEDCFRSLRAYNVKNNKGWQFRQVLNEIENLTFLFSALKNKANDAKEFIRYFFDMGYGRVGYDQYLEQYIRSHKSEKPLIKAMQERIEQEATEHGKISMEEWFELVRANDEALAGRVQNPDEDAVILSTLHSSKGLEWKMVHIIDVNDKSIPHESAEDVEEERRLFYVGVTRAKDQLCLHYLNGRKSPFIAECMLG